MHLQKTRYYLSSSIILGSTVEFMLFSTSPVSTRCFSCADAECFVWRKWESTAAQKDWHRYRVTLKIKSFFKVFSLLWIYLVLFWKTQIPRACTVLYLKFEHQFHFSFIELNGNCGLLSSRYIWSIGESL